MANKYVDFSATNNGDGTAPGGAASPGATGAFNTLASITFTTGDNVWIRRTSGTFGTTLTLSQTVGVNFIGWPLSGDANYSGRPSAGTTAGWDADSGTYATWNTTTAAAAFIVSGQNYNFFRFKVNGNVSSWTGFTVTGNTNTFTTCQFISQNATQGNITIFNISGSTNLFNTCTFEGPQSSTTTFTMIVGTGTKNSFESCTITIDNLQTKGFLSISGNDNWWWGTTINVNGTSSGSPIITVSSSDNRIFDTHIVSSGSNNSYNPLTISGNYNYIVNFKTDQGGGGTPGMLSISGSSNIVSMWNFNQAVTGTNGIIFTGSGNQVVLKNGTFSASSQDINFGTAVFDNWVMCNNVTYSTTPIIATGYLETNYLFSMNHNKTLGAYYQSAKPGTIQSSSVVRTGGEAFSLVIAPGIADLGLPRGDQQIGVHGFETIQLALTTGSHTITVYGAHKGWSSTPPLGHNIWIESEYLDGSGNFTHVTSRSYGTSLSSDSSTWTGDTSLTDFLMSLTFTVGTACVVPVRIYFGDFVASAIVYVDPKPVVT